MKNYTDFEYKLMLEMREVEAILADALGYPYDINYGWVIGDHTAVTLAMEAKDKLRQRN